MKQATHLFLFLLLIHQLDAQIPVWNVQLKISSATNLAQGSIQLRGDRYLVYSQKRIIELDQAGTVTAAVKAGSPSSMVLGYGEFIREETDPQTGKPYFLVSSSGSGNSVYTLRISEYHPGIGFTNETMLDEMFGGTSSSPFFLARNDSVFVILGRKYFRQVTHHADHSVVVDWERPNTISSPSGGVLAGDSIVGITQDGHIFALDLLGSTLWDRPAPLGLTHLEKIAGGFLACNRTSLPYAASVIKFSADGTVLWNNSFPDQAYEFLLAEPDGSITVTGRSDSSTVVLHHLDQEGNTIWRKTYQPGMGTSLLRTPDGGYILAGLDYNRYLVIKTDQLGMTGPVKTPPLPEQRKIENSVLSSVFLPSATLFFNGAESTFFVPKENMATLIFAAAPWLGGLDQDSVLHFAASLFNNDGRSDYRTGRSETGATDFNRVWAISRSSVEALQQDWRDNGVIDQPVPEDLLTWPAKGNPDFKYNLDFSETTTDRDLLPAPFVDLNDDGKYSVYDGDYPRIKGDQMAWWVLTDSTLHSRTNSIPFVLDVSISAYVYDCLASEKLNNSLFVDFEFINRSNNNYKDMFAGLWSDLDLGCAYDDYIGSLPAANAFYVYNQDAVDGQAGATCSGGTPTYGEDVPVGSISFTNVALNKFIYYNNGAGIPIPLPNTTDPTTAEEHNLYLHGKWRDGTTPTYNGQPIDFSFPDNPADTAGNTMCYGGGIPTGDRRAIGSHGPFDFAPNDTFDFRIAFTYHPDIPLPCPDIFGTVQNDLTALHALVQSGALDAPVNLPPVTHLQPGQAVLLDATVPGATAYAWSNGATTPTVSINQAGAYSVTITRSTGCTTLETVLVTAATPTVEPAWLDALRIFPNPSAGQIQVELHGVAQDQIVCTLYNSLGELVQRQRLDFQSGALSHLFDYRYLPAGMYTLQLRAGEKMQYAKVVLQR